MPFYNRYVYMALGLFLVVGLLFLRSSDHLARLHINGGTIVAQKAESISQQTRGLSGRKALNVDRGMLFIFPNDSSHPIWMKDMLIPLDIIWLDSSGRVVSVLNNVSPNTFPAQFKSDRPSRYVLELSEAAIEHYKIKPGDRVEGL